MPDASSSEGVVEQISVQGWLQGDIVPFDALVDHLPGGAAHFDGKPPTHLVLISHSCTVHARRYEDAPLVEWMACKRVKKASFNAYLGALNPRNLHLPLGEKLHLDLKIHRRVWTQRSVLPTLKVAEDVGLDAGGRETLGFWLSHAYNRIAMPDALVERLKSGGGGASLAAQIDGFLSEHNHLFRSAWVSFNPKDELDDVATPYEVQFRFLLKRECARELQGMQDALTATVGPARDLGGGLVFDGAEVSPLQDFTMLDAEDFVRYNLHDWLSLGEEDEDEDGDE